MANAKRIAKKTRRGSRPAAKAVSRSQSKRGAPKNAKTPRKRAAVNRASRNRHEQAPLAATMSAQRPVAVAASRERAARAFPFFWPALAMMRMWLGPRETGRAAT
jgi:hypothetical protein